MTDKELQNITRKIDSLVITAPNLPELYRKLNTLKEQGSPNWQTLRVPVWRNGMLIAVVINPDLEACG